MTSNRKIGIYKITNPMLAIYIGQSRNIISRFYKYKRGHCKHQPLIYSSIQEYGSENHSFEIIHQLTIEEATQEKLDELECFYIDKYQNEGFNILNAREGGLRGRHTEKVKKIIKEKRALQVTTNETRQKMSAVRKAMNIKLSDEHRKRISEKNKGRGNGMYGVKISEEQKKKMLDGRKKIGYPKGKDHPLYGIKRSQETRNKMIGKVGKWMLGRKLSPETIIKKQLKMYKPISQYTKDGEWIKDWPSAKHIKEELGINQVSGCCRGERKSAGGFVWKYKNIKI